MTGLLDELRTERHRTPVEAARVRTAARVPQWRLAAELGVDRVTLARWELGWNRPRPEARRRWNDLLDQLEAWAGR